MHELQPGATHVLIAFLSLVFHKQVEEMQKESRCNACSTYLIKATQSVHRSVKN